MVQQRFSLNWLIFFWSCWFFSQNYCQLLNASTLPTSLLTGTLTPKTTPKRDFANNTHLDSTKTQLYIAGLFPLGVPGWIGDYALQSLSAIKIAIDEINNRQDILPEHELVLVYRDTRASIGMAMTGLFDMLYTPPIKICIIGEMLSFITQQLVEVTGHWKIMQMAFASSAIELSDRQKYPYFFRTIASAARLNPVQLEIMKQFGWNKVATLHETVEPHAGVSSKLQELLEQASVSVLAAESFNIDPTEAIRRLKDKDVRIIIGNFYAATARKVFCEAYKLGMYGPKYQWFVIGYYTNKWWERPADSLDCNASQLYEATDGYLTVTWSMNGRDDKPTVSGKTPLEFRNSIAAIVDHSISLDGQDPAANAYDGLWAIAFCLNATYSENTTKRLDSYIYRDQAMAATLAKNYESVNFYGASGPVSFSSEGDRIGVFLVEQNRDGSEEVIATYKPGDPIHWLKTMHYIWRRSDGVPPYDSDNTRTIELLQSISSTVFLTMCVLSGCGVILTLTFLIFNIWKRKNRQIKMSSPNLNNVISCGILLAYSSVILGGLDFSRTTTPGLQNICRVRTWILSFAFTLAFGGMFTKMWRVYSIVIHNKTKRKSIKDHHLVAIIGVLLLIDFSILIPREIVDPFVIEEQRSFIKQTPADVAEYRRYQKLYVICTSQHAGTWLMTLIIYKAILMLFGSFLAWQTRNINIPALNDSNYVGLSIYNVMLCSVVATPVSFLNPDNLNITYALVAGLELFCTTSTLSMLFFPKIKAVYWKPSAVGTDQQSTVGMTGTRILAHNEEHNSGGHIASNKGHTSSNRGHTSNKSISNNTEQLRKSRNSNETDNPESDV